ncbi:MAG: hypothetical protein OXG40_14990 [Acidimicrobiaceae bacterium]|nr:hypothetical protein [Acidimicrobiaceae bacterium]MDE0516019.1 hypothetical protein [Acidimicrobiaceae bacterium]
MSVLHLPAEHYAEEINVICAQLDASEGEHALHTVFHALEKLGKRDDADSDGDHGDRTWDAVAAALAYYLREGESDDERLQGYGSFGPMWIAPVGDGRSNLYPAEPAKVPEETREVWRALAGVETLDPLVRGRLCDLLWELSDGPRPYAYAEAAVLCHLEHSRRENAEPSGRDESARRAAALAATLNNRTLLSESLHAIEQRVANSLDSTCDEFEIVVSGLQTLVDYTYAKRHRQDTNPDDRDARVRALIERSLQTYRHPVEQEELLDLAMAAAEDVRVGQRLRDEQIQVAESATEGTEGILRMVRLENARRMAARHGDSDAERRIRRRIEEADMSEAMSEISTEIEVDAAEIRNWVERLMESGRGPQGPAIMLLHYGIHGVPVSSPDQSRTAIAEFQAEHPLLTILKRDHIGPYNSVSITVPGGELRARSDLGEYDAFAINLFAVASAMRFMDEMRLQYDLSGEEMAAWFASAGIPARLAERIGVSYERWAAGDHVSAVSVLVLVVEGAVRHLAYLRGIPVTKTQSHDDGEQTSELRSLGRLIEALGTDDAGAGLSVLPVEHVRYLEAALVDRWSMNLRNILAHDAEAVLDQPTYWVLFHIVCLLAAHTNVTLQEESAATTGEG